MKIPVTSLCAHASIATSTFYDAMEGRKAPAPATLTRLNAALGRFKLAVAGDIGPLSASGAYRMSMVLAALQMKADARAALTSDPARRANADPIWAKAAQVRRLAFWITNALLGFRQAEIARIAGVTKQAVSNAIKELADLRDEDKALDRICCELEEIFHGV